MVVIGIEIAVYKGLGLSLSEGLLFSGVYYDTIPAKAYALFFFTGCLMSSLELKLDNILFSWMWTGHSGP